MQDKEKENKVGEALGNCPEISREKKAAEERRFSKAQLLVSERFSGKRDVLEALLSDEREYSICETDKIIEKFLKGKVK